MAKALPFPGLAATYEFGRNYLSLGYTFFERGYAEQSAGYFRQAMEDDPQNADAVYGYGSALLQLQKNDEARECFERVLALKAGSPGTVPNALNNLGILAARDGRTDDAITYGSAPG